MRTIDIALLYLRVTIGAMLLLHNIGKFQNYNEIISSYHAMEGFAASFYLLLFSIVECATALMLIIGWRVRLAAAVLIIGTIFALVIYFPTPSVVSLELQALYTFVYLYLFISGGGLYSIDGVKSSSKS